MALRDKTLAHQPRVSEFVHGRARLAVISIADEREEVSLSVAELKVAQLAAKGATNVEIAAARGVSPRTIANQIASVLRKLGAPSRRAIGGKLAVRQDA